MVVVSTVRREVVAVIRFGYMSKKYEVERLPAAL
jgi:hypothetical protein